MVKLLASYDPTVCRITLIDSEGQTPLHRTATKNKVAVIEYLLDQVREFWCWFVCLNQDGFPEGEGMGRDDVSSE